MCRRRYPQWRNCKPALILDGQGGSFYGNNWLLLHGAYFHSLTRLRFANQRFVSRQTELQHGSNVAGLETTATFDEQTDEFIIHTPSVSATKWWIGGAAHSATHGAVFAQLWVKGKCHGVKTFIVPLRDPKTYHTLSGITIGDLGSKMGRSGVSLSCRCVSRRRLLIWYTSCPRLIMAG